MDAVVWSVADDVVRYELWVSTENSPFSMFSTILLTSSTQRHPELYLSSSFIRPQACSSPPPPPPLIQTPNHPALSPETRSQQDPNLLVANHFFPEQRGPAFVRLLDDLLPVELRSSTREIRWLQCLMRGAYVTFFLAFENFAGVQRCAAIVALLEGNPKV